MKSNPNKFQTEHGFSLIEILIVITIIVIVSALAVMEYRSSNARFKRINIATELKVSFERARFDSIKRRAEAADTQAKVLVAETAITLSTDNNLDGVINGAGDSPEINFAAQNITISKYENATVLPVIVYFNQRGEVTAIDANNATVNPVFLVCNSPFTTVNSSNCNVVLITPTGTVNMLTGGSTPPGFAAPAITSIPPTDYINTFVSLFTGTPVPTPSPSVTPTPDPSVTPTPDPSATPTPDPSVTPTPDPSVTPTPTPTATQTPTPTPTPTPPPTPTPTISPTPVPVCSATAPASVVFAKNGSPKTITVNYTNAVSTTFTMTKTGFITSVSPTSVTNLASSGSFSISVVYPNGTQSGTSTVVISGCGTPQTVNVTVN